MAIGIDGSVIPVANCVLHEILHVADSLGLELEALCAEKLTEAIPVRGK